MRVRNNKLVQGRTRELITIYAFDCAPRIVRATSLGEGEINIKYGKIAKQI